MIVFGGYRSCTGHLNETWFLDLHLMIWTSPDYNGVPPSPRRGHGAAIIDKSMYIFGGYNGAEHLSDFHVLNVESMVWEIVDAHGDQPTPRRQHAMTAVGRHLVVFGGYDGKAYLNDTYVFDTGILKLGILTINRNFFTCSVLRTFVLMRISLHQKKILFFTLETVNTVLLMQDP